jgi:hypothetical protein
MDTVDATDVTDISPALSLSPLLPSHVAHDTPSRRLRFAIIRPPCLEPESAVHCGPHTLQSRCSLREHRRQMSIATLTNPARAGRRTYTSSADLGSSHSKPSCRLTAAVCRLRRATLAAAAVVVVVVVAAASRCARAMQSRSIVARAAGLADKPMTHHGRFIRRPVHGRVTCTCLAATPCFRTRNHARVRLGLIQSLHDLYNTAGDAAVAACTVTARVRALLSDCPADPHQRETVAELLGAALARSLHP